MGGWKWEKKTNMIYTVHQSRVSAENRFDKQDNITHNSLHMLYFLKRCISHAYLLQDHNNDYSWITYLKNQVLNLHHSVREGKKKISR